MIILILIIFMIPIVLMTIPGSYTILFSGTIAFYFRKLFGHYLLCMVFTIGSFYFANKLKSNILAILIKISWIFSVLSFEFIQEFIPTRYFSLRDLVINIYGLLTGVLVYFLLCMLDNGRIVYDE